MAESGLQVERHNMDGLVIDRPVFDAEKLVAATRFIAAEVFGEESAGLIAVSDEEASREHDIPLKTLVSVGLPRVRVAEPEDLRLRQYELWSPHALNHEGKFRYAARQLIRRAEKVYRPVVPGPEGSPKYKTSGLYAVLTRIGLEHGFLDQTDIPIKAWSLSRPTDPDQHGRVHLSIALHPTDAATNMLVAQSKACQQGIAEISKRVAYPSGVTDVHMPFCTLPASMTAEQGERFVGLVEEQVRDASLRVGSVMPQVTQV